MEQAILDDLAYLWKEIGPWDLVLFTGDLTQKGTKEEFEAFEKYLLKLWDKFKAWGFEPKLLAVPGNHDLIRPSNATEPALITLLHNWDLPAVQTPFWENNNCPQRLLISTAFDNFSQWWQQTAIPKPDTLSYGLLPGDWSATFTKDGLDLGIVGLNSAYLQLAGGNFEKKLHLDVRQLHGACKENGAEWTRQQHSCLLLTHHPISWLSDEAQKHFSDEIHFPPERFALHLFGHQHEANLTTVSHGVGNERRGLQGSSLFGLEHWGENQTKREHGYSLSELQMEDSEYKLRVWPRRAIEKQGGGRKLDRDQSFNLDERDGGTKPIVVKRPGKQAAISSEKSAMPATPEPTPARVPTYDPRNPPFYVPYRQKGDQVIGREDALEKVRQQLTAGRRTAIGQTAVFQGLGGLGKTQLAVEYAYYYRGAYPNGVIWLTADQDLDAQLVDLAVKAHWVAPVSDHSIKLEIAWHRLRSYSDCLIVFDNLEDMAAIRNYLPEPPASPHILVTSRIEQPDFSNVPIDVLNPDQSLCMLTREAGRQPDSEDEWAAAREIAQALDGLPLALELAGAYLYRRPVGWRQYLDLLQHNLRQALPHRLASLTSHEADLYSTLQVSESVFAEEPRLLDLLDVLTWSGPAPMSMELLATLVGASVHSELIGALGLGTALRILQPTPDGNSYAIHRLVREVRREQAPLEEKPTWAADLCRSTGDWFDSLRKDFTQLSRFEAEIDHLREWHGHALKFAPKQASRLTWLQAYPPFHRGQPQESQRRIELALDEYAKHGCDDRPLLANIYSDLGYQLNQFGHSRHALELAEQALAIRRELFGERHADTATSLNNIASYHDQLGNTTHALGLAEQALAIHRELFGERHADTARSLSNISFYHHQLGNTKHALELAEQALAIRRELFGEQHPATANSLSNITGYHAQLGNTKHALELAEQALAIRRELFGEQHPDTATSLNNIAGYHHQLGNTKHALELAEQALAIYRELLGERHPDTATSLNNIAGYHHQLGNTKHALELAEQALAIRRELFGEQHPKTANSLHNLADLLLTLGKSALAYHNANKAYEIHKQLLGSNHPSTLETAKLLTKIKWPGFRVPPSKKSVTNKKR